MMMMEVVVVTTAAISRAKPQSNRHHQQTNTQLFAGRMPFLSSNQQRQNTQAGNHRYWLGKEKQTYNTISVTCRRWLTGSHSSSSGLWNNTDIHYQPATKTTTSQPVILTLCKNIQLHKPDTFTLYSLTEIKGKRHMALDTAPLTGAQ